MFTSRLQLRGLIGRAITIWATRQRQSGEAVRRKKWAATGILGLLIFGTSLFPAFAGDSLYGKVTAVKSANLVTITIGTGQVNIRIAGTDVPKEGRHAEDAKKFVSDLVLGKNARLRLDYRAKNKEMVGRLQTDDPEIGIKDVGLELVRAGLARRQPGYDYKYHELSAAENEARKAQRGVWVTSPTPQPK